MLCYLLIQQQLLAAVGASEDEVSAELTGMTYLGNKTPQNSLDGTSRDTLMIVENATAEL